MGYYSSVGLATYKKHFMEMLEEARRSESGEHEITHLFTQIADHIGIVGDEKDDNAVVVVTWGYVKWYETFESVRFVENWMDMAVEKHIPFEFVRCGEEYSDTDTRCVDDGHFGYGEYVQVLHEVYVPNQGHTFDPNAAKELKPEEVFEQLEFDFEGLMQDVLGEAT